MLVTSASSPVATELDRAATRGHNRHDVPSQVDDQSHPKRSRSSIAFERVARPIVGSECVEQRARFVWILPRQVNTTTGTSRSLGLEMDTESSGSANVLHGCHSSSQDRESTGRAPRWWVLSLRGTSRSRAGGAPGWPQISITTCVRHSASSSPPNVCATPCDPRSQHRGSDRSRPTSDPTDWTSRTKRSRVRPSASGSSRGRSSNRSSPISHPR